MSHDAIVGDIANGTNDLSPQAGTSTTDIKPNISSLHVAPATTYTHPSGPSSAMSFTRLPLPQLPKANTPKVKHWFEASYKDTRKKGKNGEANLDDSSEKVKGSILSCYMEDENGDEIPKPQRDEARQVAKGFFNSLLRFGWAPPVWGRAGIDIQNEYLHIMEDRFPFLRLCDNHWKARRIATNSYSQWYGKTPAGKAAALVKSKAAATAGDIIDVDADDAMDKSSKRARTEDDGVRHSKRPRVEAFESAPPPLPVKITTTRQRLRVRGPFYLDYMRR